MKPESVCRNLRQQLLQMGELLRRTPLMVHEKAPGDVVTELDRLVEEQLRAWLLSAWPGSAVVGEEDGGQQQEWTWWLDPVDGTSNLAANLGRSAISVALYREGCPHLAVVYDPFREEMFWALSGGGCWLGEQSVRVCSQRMAQSVLAMGFGPPQAIQDAEWRAVQSVMGSCRSLRMLGCASLEMAYVACGRLGAYWEFDLKPWDVAAGLLLVREAGGLVLDRNGHSAQITSENFVVSSPSVWLELEPHLAILRS